MPFLFGVLVALASCIRTSNAYSAFDALHFHPAQRSYYSGPEKYERKWLQCMQELQELKRKGYGQQSSEYSYEQEDVNVKEMDSDEKNYPPNYKPAFHYEQLNIPDVILPLKIHNVPSYPQRMANYAPMRGTYPAVSNYGQRSQQPQQNYAQKPPQQPNYSKESHYEESGQTSYEAQHPYNQQNEAQYEEKLKQEYVKPEDSYKSGSKEGSQYQEKSYKEEASKEYGNKAGNEQKSASKEVGKYHEESHKEEYASKEYSNEEGYDQKSASNEDGPYQEEYEREESGHASEEYSKEGGYEHQNQSDEPYNSDEETEGSQEHNEGSYSNEEAEGGYGGQQSYEEGHIDQPMNPPPQNIQPGQPQPMSPNVQPMPPQMPQPVQPQPLPMQPPPMPAQVPTSQNEQATLGIPQQQPVPPPVDPAAEPQPAQQETQAATVQQEGNTTCKLSAVEACCARAICAETGQVQKDCSREGDDLIFDTATQDCKSIDSVPECSKDAYCGSKGVQMGQRTLVGGNCSKMAYLCGVPSVDNGQDGRLTCTGQNIVNPNNLEQCIARSAESGC